MTRDQKAITTASDLKKQQVCHHGVRMSAKCAACDKEFEKLCEASKKAKEKNASQEDAGKGR